MSTEQVHGIFFYFIKKSNDHGSSLSYWAIVVHLATNFQSVLHSCGDSDPLTKMELMVLSNFT